VKRLSKRLRGGPAAAVRNGNVQAGSAFRRLRLAHGAVPSETACQMVSARQNTDA
jgi:hypothetical protein